MAAGGGKEMEIAIKIAGKVESSFKNALSQATKGLGTITKTVASATAAAAAAVGAMGVAAINTGADFEKSMSGLAATAGIDAGSEQYQRLENAAREMGRATSKSAAESADALQYMALAGWSVEDSIKGLPSILHLSEASGMELARTSDMVTDTMSALGISINELPGYLDVVAKAQNTTNQSAEQLMEAYLGVGGTLKSLGVSTEESATALGVLANRGTKGSEAGTALNAIMVNLTTGAGQAGKAMEALGVSAFDSEGNFIGLKATLEKVNEATKGMTQEERNAALAAIGGKQHLDSLQKLMAGLNDTTADGTQEWAAITEGLKDAGGALEEMRNRKVDNLAGDIDVIKSAASDLGISIYKDINTPLRSAVQLGTDMITELNNAYGSGGMEGMVGAVGGCVAEVVNTIADYAPQVVSMGVDLLENFISGITDNSGALATAASEVITVFVEGLFTLVPQVILAGIDILTQFVQSMTAQLPQLISTGTQAIVNFVNGIIQRLPEVISTALTLVQTLVNSIGQNAPMLISAAIQLIGNLVLGIASMLPQLLQMGIQLILSLVQGIISNLPQILQMGVQIIISLVSGITQMLPMIIQGGIQLIISLIQGIIANLGNIVQAAVQIVITLATGLIQAIPQLIAAIPQLVGAIIDTILSTNWLDVGIQIIKGLIDGILSTGKSLWNAIKSLFTGGEVDIPNTSSQSAAVVNSYASGINSNAGTVTAAANSMAANAFSGMDTSGATAAGTLAGTAFSTGLTGSMAAGGLDTAAFSANMTNMGTTGATALNTSLSAGLATPVDTSGLLDAGAISTNMTAAGTQGASAFTTGLNTGLSATTINTSALAVDTSGLTTTMTTAGTQGATAIGTGMTGNSQAVTQAATTLGNDVNTALDSGWNKANTSAQTAMQRLATTVTSAASSAASAVKAAFENMTITIPKPRIPTISVSTENIAYGEGGNVKVPQFSVNWNALGGIFERPTIFNTRSGMQGVGEAGAEAVLPLDTLWARMRDIVSGEVRANSGASVIETLLEKLKNAGGGGGGRNTPQPVPAGGPSIQYSPVYNLYGNAGKQDAVEAERISQAEFNRMMKRWQKDNGRTKF